MTFLSASHWAVLLPLLALPMVIHWLNQGFPYHFKFPTVDLIKETMARRSRWHRWRHWILMLLRTMVLLLLALAFLLPVLKRFGADPAAAGARDLLIVFDHSVSMEHRGDGPSSRERAVHEAVKLIDSLDAEDAVNILLMDSNPSTCFVVASKDHAEAKRFLARLKPGLSRGEVNLANAVAARMLPRSSGRAEVYYLSDFQRKNWANADFTALPPAAQLFFVDAGPARRDNRAILDARLTQSQILAGDTVFLEIQVGNFAREPFEGRITVTLDGRFGFDQEVSIPPWSTSKLTVPVAVGGTGVHLCEVRLPADALVEDNRFFLTLSVRENEEVLIVTDGSEDHKGSAYFLKTALNPFEGKSGSLLPRVIDSGHLSANRLAGVSKLFFTRIDRLSEEACEAVTTFLFQGGGLVYFLDGRADPENLIGLERAIGREAVPLRPTRRHTASNVVAGAQQVVRGEFKSPYLRLFQGSARQNLALLEFYDYYQASATGAGEVLLVYADESPAMGVMHHGLGTALLMNFSAGELSSNLARQRIFPAWIQDLVKAISADEPPPVAYTVGDILHTEVWRSDMDRIHFLAPDGGEVTVQRDLVGERYRVSFRPEQLGFYTLGSPTPLYAFGVNASADEADLRPIDKTVLPREFAEEHEAHFVAGREDFDELAKGRSIFHWFVLGALGFLVMESGFQLLIRRKAI